MFPASIQKWEQTLSFCRSALVRPPLVVSPLARSSSVVAGCARFGTLSNSLTYCLSRAASKGVAVSQTALYQRRKAFMDAAEVGSNGFFRLTARVSPTSTPLDNPDRDRLPEPARAKSRSLPRNRNALGWKATFGI